MGARSGAQASAVSSALRRAPEWAIRGRDPHKLIPQRTLKLNSRPVFCYPEDLMASNHTARRTVRPVVSVSLLLSLLLIGVGILMPTFSG